jgi:hypothetical protein
MQECVDCPRGQTRATDMSQCHPCNAGDGYVDTINFQCGRTCGYDEFTDGLGRPFFSDSSYFDTYTPESLGGCYKCLAGKSFLTQGNSVCPGNSGPTGNDDNMRDVAATTTNCYPSNMYGAYIDGKTELNIASSPCDYCAAGFYGDCGPENRLTCNVTMDPTQPKTPNSCVACPIGKYDDSPGNNFAAGTTTEATGCQLCTGGFYSTAVASTQCTQCPEGKLSDCPTTGCTSTCDCVECVAGKFANYELGVCSDCDAGKFSDGLGVCRWCEKGKYSALGAEGCSKCPVGKFSRKDGTECEDCPGGVVCFDGILKFADETFTSLGMVQVNVSYQPSCDTSSVAGCQVNNFTDAMENDTIVYQCPISGACIGGDNITCKEGFTGAVCGACVSPGFIMVAGNCVPCPAGANFEARDRFIAGLVGVTIALWFLCAFVGPVVFFRKILTEDQKRARVDAALAKRSEDVEVAKKTKGAKIVAGNLSEQAAVRQSVGVDGPVDGVSVPKPNLNSHQSRHRALPMIDDEPDIEGETENAVGGKMGQMCSKCMNTVYKTAGKLKSEKMKIAFSWAQVLNIYKTNFTIRWPEQVLAFFDSFSFVNLNFMELFNFGCFGKIRYYETFTVMMLTPIMLTAFCATVLGIGLLYARVRKKADKGKWVSQIIRFWGLLHFMIFPTLCSTLFRVFPAMYIEGHWYLNADMTINCDYDNPERIEYLTFGGFCVLMYPIGLLVLFAFILVYNRKSMHGYYIVHNEKGAPIFRSCSLTDPNAKLVQVVPKGKKVRAFGNNRHKVTIINREAWIQFRFRVDWDDDGDDEATMVWTLLTNEFGEQPYIKSNEWKNLSRAFGWMYGAYEAQFFFWEIVEFGRKLLLSSLIIFISPGQPLQIVAGILVMLFFLVLMNNYKPYENDSDDFAQGLAFFSLTLTLLIGLTFRIQDEMPQTPNTQNERLMLAWMIIFINSVLIVCAMWLIATTLFPALVAKIMGEKKGVLARQRPEKGDEVQKVRVNPASEPYPHVEFAGIWYRPKWVFEIPLEAMEAREVYEIEVKTADPKFQGHIELEDGSVFQNPNEKLMADENEPAANNTEVRDP